SPVNPQQLEALIECIVDSGALGKSKTYANILRYLGRCSIAGSSPKEISIAIDVLQRDGQFDISRDSIVRVHVYHLRNKLRKYFEKHGPEEPFHLCIPKGQYDLDVSPRDGMQGSEAVEEDSREEVGAEEVFPLAEQDKPDRLSGSFGSRPLLFALLLLALLGNAWQWWKPGGRLAPSPAGQPLAEFSFWSNLLD